MSEQYGFFNSAIGDVREYNSEQFAELFSSFFNSGIANTGTGIGLKVMSSGGMNVIIKSGYAILGGHYYKNNSDISFVIDASDTSLNRIDRVVLKLDLVARTIKVAIKKGSIASVPIAPVLQRDISVFEMSLAQLRVKANATTVIVTDERLDTDVCGLVSVVDGVIPAQEMWDKFDVDWSGIKSQWDTWYNNVYSQVGSQTFVMQNVPSNPVINDIWVMV